MTLRSLTLRGLPPPAQAALALLLVRKMSVDAPLGPAIEAQLNTPRGLITLTSH